VNAQAQTGLTALHVAAQQDEPLLTELLISKGAKVDVKAKTSGITALHIAAGLGRLEVAKVLLRHGASLTVKNNEGQTAIDLSQRPVINPDRAKDLEKVHELLVAHAEKADVKRP
jgi:ankyrin repeat protein